MKKFSFAPTLTLKGRKFKGPRGWSGKPSHPPLTDIPIAAYIIAAGFDVVSTAVGDDTGCLSGPGAHPEVEVAAAEALGGVVRGAEAHAAALRVAPKGLARGELGARRVAGLAVAQARVVGQAHAAEALARVAALARGESPEPAERIFLNEVLEVRKLGSASHRGDVGE